MKQTVLYIRLFSITYLITWLFFYNIQAPLFAMMFSNYLLAYIPFELSLVAVKSKNKFITISMIFIWMLFYPNSPYLLTDFFHLESLDIYNLEVFNLNLFDWTMFSIITLGIIFGYIIGVYSVIIIAEKLKLKNRNFRYTFFFAISYISGFAIYLGRFSRLHSHYLLFDTLKVIEIITTSITTNAIIFSFITALWQIFIIILIDLLIEINYKNE